MPKLEHFEAVDADLQTIWRVLLDRIENPQRYLAGVESFDFPESTEEYAIRDVVFEGVTLRERITIDEQQGEVRYELVDHPLYVGDVVNALIPPAPNDPKAKPVVQFRMNWQPRNSEAETLDVEAGAVMQESMRDAVHFVKEMAEKLEARQGAR